MSATSSKSRLVLFLLVVVALVFLVTSFMTLALTSGVNGSESAAQLTCTIVQTGEEKMFGDCVPAS
jgi:hypothetical protein